MEVLPPCKNLICIFHFCLFCLVSSLVQLPPVLYIISIHLIHLHLCLPQYFPSPSTSFHQTPSFHTFFFTTFITCLLSPLCPTFLFFLSPCICHLCPSILLLQEFRQKVMLGTPFLVIWLVGFIADLDIDSWLIKGIMYAGVWVTVQFLSKYV